MNRKHMGFVNVTLTATPNQLRSILGVAKKINDGKVNYEFCGVLSDQRAFKVYDWCIGRKIGDDEKVTWNIGACCRKDGEDGKRAVTEMLATSLCN